MRHLTRNVCDACAVWCHFDRDNICDENAVDKDRVNHYSDGYTSDPRLATCVECLLTAKEYGYQCAVRCVDLHANQETKP